jgi:hypothetical protein
MGMKLGLSLWGKIHELPTLKNKLLSESICTYKEMKQTKWKKSHPQSRHSNFSMLVLFRLWPLCSTKPVDWFWLIVPPFDEIQSVQMKCITFYCNIAHEPKGRGINTKFWVRYMIKFIIRATWVSKSFHLKRCTKGRRKGIWRPRWTFSPPPPLRLVTYFTSLQTYHPFIYDTKYFWRHITKRTHI